MEARTVRAFGPPGYFYECPRWHDGHWLVSDMRGKTVFRLDESGEATVVIELDDRPGGLGWLADGTMLVVSMEQRCLHRLSPDGAIASSVDLAPLVAGREGFLNDLVVSPRGDIFIGFCQDPYTLSMSEPLGALIRIDRLGDCSIAAEGLAFPNGMAITPDGLTLVVAETGKPRLSAFAIADDGTLGQRREWATLDEVRDRRADRSTPIGERPITFDGCGMDSEGHVWAAEIGSGCLRIAPGGEVVDSVILPDGLRAYACMLGGPDGRSLMICGADDKHEERMSRKGARLFLATVDVPAA